MSRQFRSDDTDKWKYGFGDGSDGDLTISSNTTEAPIDSSCSGSSGNSTLSATNASFAANQIILIHQTRGTGAGNWELNKIASYSSGTITLKHPLQNTYTDSGASQAQVRVLKQYNNVTVNSGVTWTAKAWDGNVGGILGFLAKGTVTITGNISTSTKGFLKGTQVNAAGRSGEGTSGAGQDASTSANGNGAGGGGTSTTNSSTKYGGGGGGGNGATGTNGQTNTHESASATGGSGGSSAGNAGLTSMVLGGGGGSSKDRSGGDGAGIVLIIATNISIGGTIVNTGEVGATRDSGDLEGAGGGGAGGSVLIKAETATLGTTKITALGGAGGTAPKANGGAGAVGRIHLDYKNSYSGTTNPALDARQDSSLKYPALAGMFLVF